MKNRYWCNSPKHIHISFFGARKMKHKRFQCCPCVQYRAHLNTFASTLGHGSSDVASDTEDPWTVRKPSRCDDNDLRNSHTKPAPHN